MSEIKGFTFFKSYYESICELEIEDRKELYCAMVEYVFEDKKPKFKGVKKIIWTLIEPNLNTSKHRSNGNSGAPFGNQNALKNKEKNNTIKKQSKNNQKTTNDLLGMDKDKDKDKDMDMDMDTGIGKDKGIGVVNNARANFDFPSVLAYGTEKNISEDYCKKFYSYYAAKRKEWLTDEEWQIKLDEWFERDQGENKETKIIKIDEGVFKI